jgi:hypothetical protein
MPHNRRPRLPSVSPTHATVPLHRQWLGSVAEKRWVVLSVWAALCALAHAPGRGFGWHYFVAGADVISHGHGLDLYAHHDQLQSGPLTFVVVLPLVKVLPAKAAEGAGIVLMTAAGVVALWLIEKICIARPSARSDARLLAVGVPVLGVWAEVATHWTHPDDVLALLGVIAALHLFRQERSAAAALVLALAVDAKPWALLFAPMLLLAAKRDRLRAATVFLLVVAAAWLPFFVADPASLHAGQFRIPISAASVLHLFGADGGTPEWCRPAQILLGATAVLIAIRRRRWYAIVLVGVCARMLLDPATKNYYESGLLAGTALYDLAAADTLIPLTSLAAVVLVWLPSYVMTSLPVERSVLRLAFLAVTPCLVLLGRPVRAGRAQLSTAH